MSQIPISLIYDIIEPYSRSTKQEDLCEDIINYHNTYSLLQSKYYKLYQKRLTNRYDDFCFDKNSYYMLILEDIRYLISKTNIKFPLKNIDSTNYDNYFPLIVCRLWKKLNSEQRNQIIELIDV